MFDLLAHYWATQHPAFYFAPLCLVAAAGYLFGLRGYTQASADAYRRFVSAQQRLGGRAPYTWPDSAP